MDGKLTERQQRERAFYSVYGRRYSDVPVDFAPVDPAVRPRPWNPYWFCYRRLIDFYREGARRLLDFGCGWGDVAIRAAYAGYEVHGFDIAPENVAVARQRAEREGLGGRIHFTVGTAEQLHYPSGAFDVVVGIDILHHVDIPAAMVSCHRVLRPDGIMLFKEPVRAPLFDALRNTRLLRAFFPSEMSLDRHLTQDERKLDRHDIQTIREAFPDTVVHPFRLTARAQRFLPLATRLQKLDMVLLRNVGLLRSLAGFVVLEGRK